MIFPMMAAIIVDWLIGAAADLLIGLIDTVCYGLLTVAYNIFYAVAQIDLFGGGTAGDVLYTDITKRIYMILSVIMVFIFAYHLIMLVIDPEGKGKGASSQIVKDTLISIVLLIGLPLVFRYMSMFQFHVLENGTIPAIILGTNAGGETDNPGKSVATMVLISFFHPSGTTYTTFYNENGDLRDNAVDECVSEMEAESGEGDQETCEHYVTALNSWTDKAGVSALTWKDKKLRHWVQDTMSYTWIISSFAALAIAYVFFIYAIDIGVRAVKLGVLQLISPIPVVLKIFPNTKKSFETWFSHIKKTYLELFIRVAIIFFALEIIKLVPTFIGIIFQSQDSSVAGPFTKCIATVILIFGILKFGQEAPGLFKELFSVGGNLLSGVNINPLNPKSRITDNKAAMWTIGKTSAVAGAGYSQFRRQYDANRDVLLDEKNRSHWVKNTIMSLPSGLRGISSGIKQKNTTPTDLSVNALRQSAITGADAANKRYNESSRLQAYNQNMVELLDKDNDRGLGAYIRDNAKATGRQMKESTIDEWKYQHEQFADRISATQSATSSKAASLTAIIDGLNGIKSNTKDKTKDVTKQIEDLQHIINTSTVKDDPGAFTMTRPTDTTAPDYETKLAQFNDAYEKHRKLEEEYRKYTSAKKYLDEAKTKKEQTIVDELNASPESRQFTVNNLDKVLDEIKKSPNIVSEQNLDTIKAIRQRALEGKLDVQDSKDMSAIVKELTNAKIYSSALNEQNQERAKKFNTSSSSGSSSGGSSGSSSSSDGKK